MCTMSYDTRDHVLQLLKNTLAYIPHDGDEERDLREAIEDILREEA
jgi:hypothetical protein